MFFHAVSPCAITVQAAVRSLLEKVAAFKIVYNTVYDIMVAIEDVFWIVVLSAAPGGRDTP
jgi:hypothetical protein